MEGSASKKDAINTHVYALLGVIGPLLAYFFIGISISSAPWFKWSKNALSDLGHALRSGSAVYYNFGLASAGLLIAVYAVTSLMSRAKYAGLCLAASAFSLQLVAVFDEVYGHTHLLVSEAFFVLLLLSNPHLRRGKKVDHRGALICSRALHLGFLLDGPL